MEEPADQADTVAVVNAIVHVQSPDRKAVRRRFVQSTLFPLKPHETKAENSVKKEKKKVQEIVDDDDDDVEYCGSREKGRKRGKKSKRNATPQKQRSKKVAVNGKDASVIALDDIESPDNGSPQQQKDKPRVSARNGKTNGNKGTSTAKVPTHPVATHQASQPVPDLRLEAKRTAEENSRLFAGKQMHPFFSVWTAGKKDQVTTEVENNGCLDRRKERHTELGPIHVLENVQVAMESINWSNWSLCEETFDNATCGQERTVSNSDCIVGSLNFGTDLNILKYSATSLRLDDVSMGQYHGSHEDTCTMPTSASLVVVDEEVTPYDVLKNMEKDFEMNKLEFIVGNVDHAGSTSEQPKAILLESIMSHYLNRSNHPENSLWTNKYQPEKASEVCGNNEAVKFINEWLHLWHSTDFRVSQRSSNANKCSMREDDYDSYDSDSALESIGEASGLKNVLLVTGPVGSGKSAAIYACAKEQGFQVIEVNASDWRNGAVLKQKFGEAVGSHWLKRSQENPVASPNKHNRKSSPSVFTNNAPALDLNKSAVEVVSLSGEEGSIDGMQSAGDGRIPCDQSEIKTVILFEDVDATLYEDRGFISTIQQLAEMGKRPMILTSNSESPVLPDSLAREEVSFTMPSLKELIHHIYLVCAAEKANVPPCLIERYIQFCGADIRKTLMHLQFWCQSKGFVKDEKMRMMYSPLSFNLEAGHCILPKLIPWELPSSLSVFVEAEIANRLCKITMEENDSLLEMLEEEVGNTRLEKNLDFGKGELSSIEAKKEAILRENCFLNVENDITAMTNMCDFSHCSDSPVAFARRNVRRKFGTWLSDSEDEIFAVVAANDISSALDEQLPPTGAIEELKLLSEITHLNHINFSSVGNLRQSTDQCVDYREENFAEIQNQHIELAGLNYNSGKATNHSLDLLSGQLLHPKEPKLEANRNLFPVEGQVNHNPPATGNLRNQSTDNTIHFLEEKVLETEMDNVRHYGQDNPLSGQSQHCGESTKVVKRCLFPQTLDVNLIDYMVHSPQNQSTDQLLHSGKLDMAKLEHQHLGLAAGIVNHGCQEQADYSADALFAQFLSHSEANQENIGCKHTEMINVNSFSSAAVDESLNQSSDQLFHSVEEKEPEVQKQYPEAGTTSHINGAAVSNSLNQLTNQFLGISKLEEIQGQHPGSADVKHAGCPPADYSSQQIRNQLTFDEENIESIKHQLPEILGVDVVSCPMVGSFMIPVNGNVLQFGEEHQSQHSEATNLNHVINGCQSLDMSCVPESTFVLETEVNDGKEFRSGDLMEIVSPVSVDTVDPSVVKDHTSGYIERCSDRNLNGRDEQTGDSQSENEHLEASTSGGRVMDECSRMDFCRRSKSFRNFKMAAKNPVQEKWNELRQMDLRQHFISEHKNARQVLELAYGMSNLISEADLLLHPCRFLTNDSLDQEICLGEETSNFGWHDQQFQMASAIAEHGYCLYAKAMDSLQSTMGTDRRVHLPSELLAATSNSMALGKLLTLDRSKGQSLLAAGSFKGAVPTVDTALKRKREVYLQNTVRSIVPLRCHLALRGSAFHDYLSSMAHISSLEESRLAEATEKKRGRRVRVAKNYLSTSGLDLSSDDFSLLNEYNSYRKVSSKSNG